MQLCVFLHFRLRVQEEAPSIQNVQEAIRVICVAMLSVCTLK